jgi:DNA repair protein RecN (Recombination protein N)
LKDLAARLIEIHGQHEHQGLLVPESHLDLLDAYAGVESRREHVASAFQRLGALRAELETLRLDERQKLARVDLLTFQRDEITQAAPRAGEDEDLVAERSRLANAGKLLQLSAEAYQTLYEQDGAVWLRTTVGEAIRAAADGT